jgi:hypothetical protein
MASNTPSSIPTKITWDIIPPEIKHDAFYYSIINLLQSENTIKNVIEIGASSGEGSTEALLLGRFKNNKLNPNNVINIFSLEVCTERFHKLQQRYNKLPTFYPLNMSSVALSEFPDKTHVTQFYNSIRTSLNQYPIDMVLSWYDKDKEYIQTNSIAENGIQYIKNTYQIDTFDVALIDGSEFTGLIELDKVIGSKYILLDDINAYKNYLSHQKLKNNPNYQCIIENLVTRNGFSIFKKK